MNHSLYILSLTSLASIGCQSDESDTSQTSGAVEYVSPDLNGDGSINILVLGTSASISGQEGFSAAQVAVELSNILDGDPAFTGDVSVRAEDIHTSQAVTIGLGQAGDEYTYSHYSHSLLQYYYWPEDADTRMDNLSGSLEHRWDYVVIAADPFIVSTTPGYYALGAHKVASKVAEGGAQPLLMMVWDPDQAEATIDHFEEVTYRTADGAAVALSTVPAGLAWAALTDDQRDEASGHPTPGGAYLSAASIYSHITQTSAGDSEYQYDSDMAEVALDTVSQARDQAHYEGDFLFDSPFASCGITDEQLTYNHTGSSSENGILEGLSWVFDQADETLESGGDPLTTFNYGRANTNFEPEKRYQIDPDRFQYSFGFPMQDNGNHGDTSMLYGLDKRDGGVVNDRSGSRQLHDRRVRAAPWSGHSHPNLVRAAARGEPRAVRLQGLLAHASRSRQGQRGLHVHDADQQVRPGRRARRRHDERLVHLECPQDRLQHCMDRDVSGRKLAVLSRRLWVMPARGEAARHLRASGQGAAPTSGTPRRAAPRSVLAPWTRRSRRTL